MPVLDIDHLGLAKRRGIGAIQLVEDAVTLRYAGKSLRRTGYARHGGGTGKAEQSGQEQSSIHGILPICRCRSQSNTDRR